MRKSILDVDPQLKSVLDEFENLTMVRLEMAQDAYDFQDDKTKAAIDRVVGTLRERATGTITVNVGGTQHTLKISDEMFGFNLFALAVDIVRDLAFIGLRVANFRFDPKRCASCGVEL